jgi:hypothetical protein
MITTTTITTTKRGYKLKTIVGKECEVEKKVQQR